jgi:D-glycero-alpha-D-manno-heptose-7-phosphate kinase
MQRLVDSAIDILSDGIDGYDDFGRLLHEGWLLKRGLSDKVSNSQIDDIYHKGLEAGALGGKILGAGGGGFILFYIAPEKQERLKSVLAPLLHVPFRFDTLGSQVIYYAVL